MEVKDDSFTSIHKLLSMKEISWQVVDTGKASAKQNMEIDARLLKELTHAITPIIHLYDWEAPCATYGHFIDPLSYFSAEAFSKDGIQLAKRPTGGGVIFHTIDWAFSVLVPACDQAFSLNTLDNYAFVNHLIIKVIEQFLGIPVQLNLLCCEKQQDEHSSHFCMAKPTKYDVMINGKKICGGAQRRTKAGFLHQGTISLTFPEEKFLQKTLLHSNSVSHFMRENTFSLLGEQASKNDIKEARKHLSEILTNLVSKALP